MKISEIFTYFTDTIFRRDINEWRNPVIRWLVQQYRLLFYTARGLLEHGTIVRSAAPHILYADVAGADRSGGFRRGQGLRTGRRTDRQPLRPLPAEPRNHRLRRRFRRKRRWPARRAAWWRPWRW
ncbi:MAG: hypothetical protein ACLR8T_10465 [Alistipes finegoldii]